jgi:hypothetical protein
MRGGFIGSPCLGVCTHCDPILMSVGRSQEAHLSLVAALLHEVGLALRGLVGELGSPPQYRCDMAAVATVPVPVSAAQKSSGEAGELVRRRARGACVRACVRGSRLLAWAGASVERLEQYDPWAVRHAAAPAAARARPTQHAARPTAQHPQPTSRSWASAKPPGGMVVASAAAASMSAPQGGRVYWIDTPWRRSGAP